MATEQQIKEFWVKYAGLAVSANNKDKRIFPETALVQWAVETSYGTSELCLKDNNLAGITTGDGKTFLHFANLEEFLNQYVDDLHLKYYTDVLNQKNITEQMTELGLSPWAASHYKYEGISGEELTNIYKTNLLDISHAIEDAITKNKIANAASDQTKEGTVYWVQSGGYINKENALKVIEFCKANGWWAELYERI